LSKIADWHKAWLAGENMREFCLDEISQHSHPGTLV
jgi:hypothetical protein